MTDVLDRLDVVEPRRSEPEAQPFELPYATSPKRRRFAPSQPALRVAAALSTAAGVIHLVMVPSHAGESFSEGAGFAVTGWFQLLTAWLLLNRPSRALLAPIAFANTVFVGAWVWSRTAGLPIGAHSGQSESVGFVDLTTVGLEVALIVMCAVLATRGGSRRDTAGRGSWWALMAIVGVFGIASAAIASPSARDHAAHSHDAAADDKGLSALSNGHHH